MRATIGAIEKIEINNGSVAYETIGKSKPAWYLRSGLIDAIYELVRNNIIEPMASSMNPLIRPFWYK